MCDNQLESKILESIITRLGIEHEKDKEIPYDLPLFAAYDEQKLGLQLDSIDILEVAIAIKQDFGVKIGDKDMKALASIATIADYIRKTKDVQ